MLAYHPCLLLVVFCLDKKSEMSKLFLKPASETSVMIPPKLREKWLAGYRMRDF